MKAFMSTESSRHQYFEDANGPCAEREALMILRHTESSDPTGEWGSISHPMIRDLRQYSCHQDETKALIESLTDFVEE